MVIVTDKGRVDIYKGVFYPDLVVTVPVGYKLKVTRLSVRSNQITLVRDNERWSRSKSPSPKGGILPSVVSSRSLAATRSKGAKPAKLLDPAIGRPLETDTRPWVGRISDTQPKMKFERCLICKRPKQGFRCERGC